MLRRIFGPERDEVTGEWRRLHNKELYALTKYYSGYQIKKNEIGRACSTNGERRGAYRVVVGKPEGRRPLGRRNRRWKNNIKMGLREVRWGHGLVRSCSGQGKVAGYCERGNEPSGSIKCGEFLVSLRIS